MQDLTAIDEDALAVWDESVVEKPESSKLAMESLRLWSWDNCLKLLLIVSLAYAFLLSLLNPILGTLRQWMLTWWCHRTGKRSREARTPLCGLRSAISRLWLDYPPPPLSFPLGSPG